MTILGVFLVRRLCGSNCIITVGQEEFLGMELLELEALYVPLKYHPFHGLEIRVECWI